MVEAGRCALSLCLVHGKAVAESWRRLATGLDSLMFLFFVAHLRTKGN